MSSRRAGIAHQTRLRLDQDLTGGSLVELGSNFFAITGQRPMNSGNHAENFQQVFGPESARPGQSRPSFVVFLAGLGGPKAHPTSSDSAGR